jgi:AraC family transcriptional regulator
MRGRELDCPRGTILTEPAGEVHRNRIGAAGAEVMVLQMDPLADDPSIEPFRSVLIDRVNHFRHEGITLQARRLATELALRDSLSPLAAEALTLDMLVLAGRDRRTEASDAPAWLSRAEDYVRARFREHVHVADVADAVGVHPSHVASAFRAHHQVPLGQFVRKLRVEWAAVRLESSEDTISSIAFASGFADQSHLSRTFKRYMGMPPGAYRRARR